MNKKLPEFPRIPRFITEDVVSIRTLYICKVLLICCVSALLMLQIVREAVALPKNLVQANLVQNDRQKVTNEILQWKKIAEQYIGYRDVYYRIAFLEYTQGNFAEAKKYVQKALEVDPNFDAGRVLGEKISR